MRQITIIVTAALLVAGCSSRPDFACEIIDKSGPMPAHQCSELDSLDATQQKDAEDACPRLGGVIVDECTSEGLIGVCNLSFDGLTEGIHFYADGSVTAAAAEATCKQLAGTWMEGAFPDPG